MEDRCIGLSWLIMGRVHGVDADEKWAFLFEKKMTMKGEASETWTFRERKKVTEAGEGGRWML